MVFSSTVFLFVFLPVTYILYIVCKPQAVRNIILIIASLFFYAYGEPAAVFLMILSIIVNYLLGLTMDSKHKKTNADNFDNIQPFNAVYFQISRLYSKSDK